MSSIDTLKAALYGNPPSPSFLPSRDGVIDAFTQISSLVAAITAQQGDPTQALALIQTAINSTNTASTAATTANAIIQAILKASVTGGKGIFGGPTVTSVLNPDGNQNGTKVSRETWLLTDPVPRNGVITAVAAYVWTAGTVIMGFCKRDGTIMARFPVIFTTTGPQSVSVPSLVIQKGWLFGQISDGDTSSGLIGYSQYGTSIHASSAMSSDTTLTNISVVNNVTIAASYTLDAADKPATYNDITAARVPIFTSSLTVMPDAWTVNGPAWSFGSDGMTSPSSGQGWNTFIQTNWFTRLEQRVTSIRVTAKTATTIIAMAWLSPYGGAPLYEGNGRGPSQIALDWNAGVIEITSQPIGSAPNILASTPLAAGHNWQNQQHIEHGWHVRTMTVTVTDTVTLAQTTVSYDRSNSTDTDSPAGNCNDVLAWIAVAGQFTVAPNPAVLYDRPRSKCKVLVLGDSISQGDQQLAANTWSRLLDAELGGCVAVSAMGGGRAMGAYYSALNEITTLQPAWVIVAVGTNLSVPANGSFSGDSTLGTALWKAFVENIILLAKSYGGKVVLTTLLNTSYGNQQGSYNSMNGAALIFNNAYPNDVYIWQWNRALSVNGAGNAQDTSLFHTDGTHPNDAGHQKLLAQRRVDIPRMND